MCSTIGFTTPKTTTQQPVVLNPKNDIVSLKPHKIKISSPTLPYPHNYKILILWGLKEGVVDSLTLNFVYSFIFLRSLSLKLLNLNHKTSPLAREKIKGIKMLAL